MATRKEHRSFTNFGFTTILLAFVMICVVTFSALSLVTAYSDYKLSKKVADKTVDYYSAQERAYEKIFFIDQALKNAYTTSADRSSYFNQIQNMLSTYGSCEYIDSSLPEKGYLVSMKEFIASDHYLVIELFVGYPTSTEECFLDIITWKSVYEKEIPNEVIWDLIQ